MRRWRFRVRRGSPSPNERAPVRPPPALSGRPRPARAPSLAPRPAAVRVGFNIFFCISAIGARGGLQEACAGAPRSEQFQGRTTDLQHPRRKQQTVTTGMDTTVTHSHDAVATANASGESPQSHITFVVKGGSRGRTAAATSAPTDASRTHGDRAITARDLTRYCVHAEHRDAGQQPKHD